MTTSLSSVCDVIMDYCNSLKLLVSLIVLVSRTVPVSPVDVETGEMVYMVFDLCEMG